MFKFFFLLELYLLGCGLDNDLFLINVNFLKLLVVFDFFFNCFFLVFKWMFSFYGFVFIDFSGNFLEGLILDYFGNSLFFEVFDFSWNYFNLFMFNFLYSLNCF